MLAYHGSFKLFTKFHQPDISVSGGTFFTTDKHYAVNFGMYIYTCKLNIENQFNVSVLSNVVVTDLLKLHPNIHEHFNSVMGFDDPFGHPSFRKSKGIEICMFNTKDIEIINVSNIITNDKL